MTKTNLGRKGVYLTEKSDHSPSLRKDKVENQAGHEPEAGSEGGAMEEHAYGLLLMAHPAL